MKRVCVVGYGAVGPVHAEAVTKAEGAELCAICDIDRERLERGVEKYGTKGYEDFKEMLKDPAIDAVHICTPHYLHYGMIVEALDAGKEVVAEKPVTMTREQFEKLLTHQNAGKICVVLQNRLNPCAETLKEILERGTLGTVKGIKGILTWHRTKEYYGTDAWRGKWATEGGGVLINQAVHTLDLLVYFAGEVKSVQGHICNYSLKQDIEVEDTVQAYLNFGEGRKGIFLATNAYSVNSAPEIELVCENGTARYMDGKLWVNGEFLAEDSVPLEGKAYWGTGHERLIRDYYEKGQHFSVFDIQNTMETMFAVYESAQKGGEEIVIK